MRPRSIFLALLLALCLSSLGFAQLTLATDPNPAIVGTPVTLTATFNTVTTGGTVQFFDTNVPIGTAPLTNGVAVLTTSFLTVGTHPLSAVFSFGSGAPIGSNIVDEVVLYSTNTALSVSPNPATACDIITLTATVTGNVPGNSFTAPPPPPSGSITFYDGTTVLGTVNLVGNSATLRTGPFTQGAHFISATYNGDALYGVSTSQPVTLTIVAAPPSSLNISFDVNPAVFGQTVNVTATVTPANATGNITFFEGQRNLGSAQIRNGAATLTLPNLSPGAHIITATFNGAAIGAACVGGSSASATLVVNRAPSTTALACSPATAQPGVPIALNATISPAGVTGTVAFRDGSNPIGSSQPVNNGRASTSTSNLSPGSHTLFADYSGDTNYLPSTGSCTVLVQTPTTTALNSAPNPSTQGQPVTLTAAVLPSRATGTVTFFDGGSPIGSSPLNNGVATLSTSGLSVGTHVLTAVYGGDTQFLGSTSNAVNQVVQPPAPPPASVFLTVTPNPAQFGQTVVMSAAVSSSTATGTVTFLDGNTQLGTAPLAGGTASFSTSTLAIGTHTITASYSGDSANGPATSNAVTLVVNRRSVGISLSAGPNPATAGQTVTLTARVSPSDNVTGSVTFTDNGSTLGTASLSGGSASFSTSGLSPGPHALVASYSGDTNNTPATSNTVNLTVLRPTQTALSASATTAPPGQSITLTASVTPAGATGTVTFSDAGKTLGTASLSGGGASISVTLDIGQHTVTASYGGDATFSGSTSNGVTITVARVVTTTALSSSPNPSTVGQTVTLTANVSASGGNPTTSQPSGTVTFSEGGTTLGTAPLSAGSATFTVPDLAQGTHTFTASYGGDTIFAPSSGSVDQVVNNNPLRITAPPATLPNATVGAAYSQQVTATGGTAPYSFSLSGDGNGLAISQGGLLSGTPLNAGNINLTVTARDSSSPQQNVTAIFNLTTNFPTLPPITINVPAQPGNVTDQPTLQFQLGQPYPLPLNGVVTLSFAPNASNLPPNYDITQNTAVRFSNGTINAQVTIPANSTAPITLPPINIGHVAGTITARLTSLVNATTNQPVPLPAQPVAGTITVPRLAPTIAAGSVFIENITASGLQVTMNVTSTTRELTTATVTFTSAPGAQLTGTTTFSNIPLTAPATTWFTSTQGVGLGGDASVIIPFTFTGDTGAIGGVSVTISNSVGSSPVANGQRR